MPVLQIGQVIEIPGSRKKVEIRRFLDADPNTERYLASSTIEGYPMVQIRVACPGDTKKHQRFLAELAAVADALVLDEHPNLIRGLGFGVVEYGGQELPYLVTEYIQGEPLNEYVKKHDFKLLPERALIIGLQIASAIEALHRHRLVHRGIIPQNFIIVLGSPFRVVATDLRFVKHLESSERVTLYGKVVGRIETMSPEQMEGKSGPSIDYWQLGVMIYGLLCGQQPFFSELGDSTEVLSKIQKGEYTPYKNHNNPRFESSVNRLLRNLLTVNPDARLVKCESMEAVIGQIADCIALLERSTTNPYQAPHEIPTRAAFPNPPPDQRVEQLYESEQIPEIPDPAERRNSWTVLVLGLIIMGIAMAIVLYFQLR